MHAYLRVQTALEPHKQYTLLVTPNMMTNAVLAPSLVLPALSLLPPLSPNGAYGNHQGAPRHPASFYGCAASVGYLTFDLLVMITSYKVSMRANGGKGQYWLYIWHHMFSIIFW